MVHGLLKFGTNIKLKIILGHSESIRTNVILRNLALHKLLSFQNGITEIEKNRKNQEKKTKFSNKTSTVGRFKKVTVMIASVSGFQMHS